MFDIGWSELLVIAVIAVVVVGPKDLPRMLRTVGKTVGKMRRMANDFQRQFNDALKEAEIDEIKKSVEAVGKDTQRDLESVGRSLDNTTAKASLSTATPVKPPAGMTGPRAVNPAIMTGPTATSAGPAPAVANGATKPVPVTPQIVSTREAEPPAPIEADNSEAPPASAAAGGR